MNSTDVRFQQLGAWLAMQPGWREARLAPASADASFRRYFRATRADGATRIIMDAPPDRESVAPYVKVTGLLEACGVHVPAIDTVDARQGFMLMEDLGGTHLLAALGQGGDAGRLYREALDALLLIQTRGASGAASLPPYDEAALRRELELMPTWYGAKHLQIELSGEETALLEATFRRLIAEALAQPVVLVHRDYHSRNLMITATRSPGIIDFQDALAGPLCYDLVSLLKDCYIAWPRADVERQVAEYRARLAAAGVPAGRDGAEFLRWFDFIGLQRHLKVLGVFARLCWRDGKTGYLADLQLTLDYVRDTAARYPELASFAAFVERRLVAGLAAANARALAATQAAIA